MEPIQVNAVLLRGMLPDLRLVPGTTLMGRVLERHAQHGLLNLGGAVLVAKLPDGVAAGQRLRLAVAEVNPEHVVMRIVGDAQPPPAPAAPPPPPAVGLPLPDGGEAHVRIVAEEPDPGAAPGTAAVTVRYDSPALGRIEMRLALGPNALVAGVGAGAGVPVELAGENAGELRAALQRAVGRPVDVHVGIRRDRVDLRV